MRRYQGVKFVFVIVSLFAGAAFAQTEPAPAATPRTGKPPIIIIPGLTGSELVNRRTGERVWFKTRRSKDDDVRLPIGPVLARNRDSLVPKDIIRSVQFIRFLPETEIYERLINGLEKRGGYREGRWDAPPKDGYQDTFYVYPYDWRRDNVESARQLIRQIEALKRRLGKPNLKFNVLAHSMGGLVARYAAMYGDADIGTGAPRPTWAGARHLDRVFLLGTPNEGSVAALDALLNGFSYVGGGLNLPFIQNFSRFDVFTIQSIYQLLPHENTLAAYGDDLKPMNVNLFEPEEWEKYGWAVWQDDGFTKKLTPQEQRNARAYFRTVLARAKSFQAALNANGSDKVPVSFFLIGGDCKDTLNAIRISYDAKKGRWRTSFKADSFTQAGGEKITSEQVKAVLYSLGDSVVTKRSLAAETISSNGHGAALPVTDQIFQCEGHTKLVTSAEVQDRIMAMLAPAAAK